ncbi:zinc finger, CCHC-type containing protein [Tanacetum coccineum]
MSTSYANVTSEPSRKSVNFCTLITLAGNGVDVVVPVESIRAISEWNTWGKYGLVKSILNSSTELFSFQFSSMDGLDRMLENGPWFIRSNPLILKKWNPDVRSSYATTMIELRADEELKDTSIVAMPKLVGGGNECPKNISSDVVKNLKNPCQAPRGVLVGPKPLDVQLISNLILGSFPTLSEAHGNHSPTSANEDDTVSLTF